MADLSSSSTDAQVEAAYDDNAGYFEDGDLSKAKKFLTACLILKRRVPLNLGITGRTVTMESLQEEIKEVKMYINGRSNGRQRVRRFDYIEPRGID